jgi:hypothetical protein
VSRRVGMEVKHL